MCTERTQFIDLGYQARSQGHRGNSPAEWSQSKPQRKGLVLLSSCVGHVVSTGYFVCASASDLHQTLSPGKMADGPLASVPIP